MTAEKNITSEENPHLKKTPFPNGSGSTSGSMLAHFGIVAAVSLSLLIPLFMTGALVDERAELYRKVIRDISETWGGTQHVSGPFLLIPYSNRELVAHEIEREGKKQTLQENQLVLKYLIVLPTSVDFTATLDPQERTRGIYRTTVYSANMTLQGTFVLPTEDMIARVAPTLEKVDYAKAFVVMGLSYPSGLRSAGDFMWNRLPLKPEPGVLPFAELRAGYRIPVALDPMHKDYRFEQSLVFNGSEGIRFTPTGELSLITLSSSWPHPSFQGSALPVERRISDEGFSATWRIPSLARSFPNLGTIESFPDHFTSFYMATTLYDAATHYRLVERAVKYGTLFIGLTFLALLVFELGLGATLHPVQYGLVGLAMVLFYLVLLSVSEHMSFPIAYTSAAVSSIAMISIYVGAAVHNWRQGTGIGLLLTGLYALLYAILQMEDYALLMGTALVLVMLGALMVVTRNLSRQE